MKSAALMTTLALVFAAGMPAPSAAADDAEMPISCNDCGTVVAINEAGRDGKPAWLGTLGDGSGTSSGALPSRPRAPGVGSSNSSIIGRDPERATLRRPGYEVVVLMEDGSRRTIRVDTRPVVSVGDRVRVAGRQVYMR